jgi:DNA-binding MarR family transcriptional regulator
VRKVSEDLQERILAYLATVDKAKNRDIATALKEPKTDVDKAVAELAKADKIEYLYIGTSYVKLKGKE